MEIWHLTTCGSTQSHGWVESAKNLANAKEILSSKATALAGEIDADCILFVVDGNVAQQLQSGEISPETALELALEKVVVPKSE